MSKNHANMVFYDKKNPLNHVNMFKQLKNKKHHSSPYVCTMYCVGSN